MGKKSAFQDFNLPFPAILYFTLKKIVKCVKLSLPAFDTTTFLHSRGDHHDITHHFRDVGDDPPFWT